MDRDLSPSEQSTPPESRGSSQSFIDRFNRLTPMFFVFIAMATAITMFVFYQTGLKSEMVKLQAEIEIVKIEVARVEQKVDSLEQKIDVRFDAMMEQFKAMNSRFDAMNSRFDSLEAILSTKVDYLDKKTDENAKAIEVIKQTLNEPSQ